MNNTQISSTVVATMVENPEPIRYSDADLLEFKGLVEEKMKKAKDSLKDLLEGQNNPNSGDEVFPSYKGFEDGLESTQKENLWSLISKQEKFISCLEGALFRIENKTYGICRETGRLIPKERLKAVPHATLCLESKLEHDKNNKKSR